MLPPNPMVQHTPENMRAVLNEIVRTVRIGPAMRVIHANEKNVFGWMRRSRKGDPKLIVVGWPDAKSPPRLFHECVKLAQEMHWRLPAKPNRRLPEHLEREFERAERRLAEYASSGTFDWDAASQLASPERKREERIRKAEIDGFKDAAFAHAQETGDPSIPPSVSEMTRQERRIFRDAWWLLATTKNPELLVMAGEGMTPEQQETYDVRKDHLDKAMAHVYYQVARRNDARDAQRFREAQSEAGVKAHAEAH